ncbi:MAG: iron dicitrate transport regulator FecR [Burkholderiales bacterium]|nr:iron dicitrate transport regulator FecR [Burkholderiales bacterium]
MNQDGNSFAWRRREWLKRALLGGALMPLLLRDALAQRQQSTGMVMIKGEVLVNGSAAEAGTLVKPGDRVVTAAGGLAVFAVGEDAFLLRQNSELHTAGGSALIGSLRLLTGKLLSVFGRGQRSITTPTAALGIRGTGIYIEVEAERTYVCTCYGVVDLQAGNMPAARETVSTTHHDAPRYIYAHGDMPIKMIEVAPVINHSDAELIMLEALVGRVPPFVGSGKQYQDY